MMSVWVVPESASICGHKVLGHVNKRSGYFRLAKVGGSELLVHWSLPVGGVITATFVHADPEQWVYFCLAYFLLVFIHEAGHVLAAVAQRLKVFTVEISGAGGLCRFERPHRVWQSVFVYTAGLLAQPSSPASSRKVS
jgi:hypothetical protein